MPNRSAMAMVLPIISTGSGGRRSRITAEAVAQAPIQDEFLKVETTGIEEIPEENRHGKPWELGALWAGAFLNYASLLTGSLLLVFGLGVIESLFAIAIGALLSALILGFVSVSGPRGGAPQIVFSRKVFGHQGAYLAGTLTLFLAVGWFAVDCVIATDALDQLLGQLGTTRSFTGLLLPLVVGISVLVAIYGHQTVVVFERYGAAVFLAFSVLLLIALAPKIHWHLAPTVHGSAHVGALILGGSVVFALVASWFSFAADYSRYLPSRTSTRSVVGWVTAGAALPCMGLAMLGVLFLSVDSKYLASGDLLGAIVHHTPKPLSIAFLLFVAVGMIWANYLDVYTAGLVALALEIRLKRWQTALASGVLGGILAYYALFVSSFYRSYENFLLVTYIWAPAWAAVVLLDLFYFRLRGYTPAFRLRRLSIRWPALAALVAGTLAAIPFVNSTLWESPLAVRLLHGADISGVVSFVIGGLVFLLLRSVEEMGAGAWKGTG